MIATTILMLLGGGAGCGAAPRTAPKHARLVFLAVFEGLHERNVDVALARGVLQAPAPGLFVAKCPLCAPARAAFEAYAARGRSGFGDLELPAPIRDGLKGADRAVQLKALEAFVGGCVERKLARTVMTDAERSAFKAWAAEGKKLGTSVKQARFGDVCPSCVGIDGKKREDAR